MKIRIEAVPITGQAWLDTLDYHVRTAVEAAGLKLDGWEQGEGWIESPDLPDPQAQGLLERLRDIPLVRATAR